MEAEKGGLQPPPYQEAPAQPNATQQNSDQPYPTQPYSAQPYPAQPYPAQPYPAQPYPGQPPQAQQYPGQPQVPPPAPPIYVQQLPPQQVENNQFMASMRQAIPKLPPCMAIFCCFINCILPGFGTIIAGFASLCCGEETESGKCGMFWINFAVGWAQFFLIIFGIGWIWSIFWGFLFIGLAYEKKDDGTATTTVVYGST